jgi:hypothetical protein
MDRQNTERKDMEWIHLAQDTACLRVIASTVMSLQVP